MGYIGNLGGWFQNMTNTLCSAQGIATKLGQNVSKGCILKVLKLGGCIFSHPAVV